MHQLQGFRTIIFNVVAITASWLGSRYGVELSEEHQLEITATIIALGNIGLRLLTKTPVGKKDQE